MFITLILGSVYVSQPFGLFTSENVVFQKINEVFINDAYWSVTFVHDLKPFECLIAQIHYDLVRTDDIMKVITEFHRRSNLTGYIETFRSLHVEVDLLNDTYKSVHENFNEYQTISENNQRYKRSLILKIGQLMNTLFGTVLENYLKNIDRKY